VGQQVSHLSFVNVCNLAGALVAATLVAAGLLRLRTGDRAAAYRRFDRALLVSIFVTQVFAFVESEFSAVFGLGLDVLLLVTLRAMMRGERAVQEPAREPAVAPA
jgi:hypothetical protein